MKVTINTNHLMIRLDQASVDSLLENSSITCEPIKGHCVEISLFSDEIHEPFITQEAFWIKRDPKFWHERPLKCFHISVGKYDLLKKEASVFHIQKMEMPEYVSLDGVKLFLPESSGQYAETERVKGYVGHNSRQYNRQRVREQSLATV